MITALFHPYLKLGLEDNLQRQLSDTGIAGALNLPKVGAVGSGGGIVEVGVVQHVEELSAKVQTSFFQ